MQAYSDPKRASEPHALPDIEVFYHDCTDSDEPCPYAYSEQSAEFVCERGWHWRFRNGQPYSDSVGPFASEAEALADTQGGE